MEKNLRSVFVLLRVAQYCTELIMLNSDMSNVWRGVNPYGGKTGDGDGLNGVNVGCAWCRFVVSEGLD